jgi:hypothetical protein
MRFARWLSVWQIPDESLAFNDIVDLAQDADRRTERKHGFAKSGNW